MSTDRKAKKAKIFLMTISLRCLVTVRLLLLSTDD
jgi:hypothetical protein